MSLPGHICFQDQLSSQHFCHLYWQPYRFTNHAYHTLSIIKICKKGIFYKFLCFKLFCWWKCVLYSKIIDLVARLFPLSYFFSFWGLLLVLYIVEEALENLASWQRKSSAQFTQLWLLHLNEALLLSPKYNFLCPTLPFLLSFSSRKPHFDPFTKSTKKW